MVDAGESLSVALKREFGEEALNSLSSSTTNISDLKRAVDQVFQQGVEVSEYLLLKISFSLKNTTTNFLGTNKFVRIYEQFKL